MQRWSLLWLTLVRVVFAVGKQRLVESVYVGGDVHRTWHQHAAAKQQIGHGAHAEAAQTLFAAHEHSFAFAGITECAQSLRIEPGFGPDLPQHGGVANVRSALEIRTEYCRGHIRLPPFTGCELNQSMRFGGTRQRTELFEVEV